MKADLPSLPPQNSHCVTKLHRFQFRLVGERPQLGDRVLAAKPFQHDADLLFG